jgi:Fe-S-cluster formation regulator IscX/YfhJ
LADENGWAFLGDMGNLILKKQPNFDPRNYGFQKLTTLLNSLQQFEVDKRETEKKGIKLVYIRNKEN